MVVVSVSNAVVMGLILSFNSLVSGVSDSILSHGTHFSSIFLGSGSSTHLSFQSVCTLFSHVLGLVFFHFDHSRSFLGSHSSSLDESGVSEGLHFVKVSSLEEVQFDFVCFLGSGSSSGLHLVLDGNSADSGLLGLPSSVLNSGVSNFCSSFEFTHSGSFFFMGLSDGCFLNFLGFVHEVDQTLFSVQKSVFNISTSTIDGRLTTLEQKCLLSSSFF